MEWQGRGEKKIVATSYGLRENCFVENSFCTAPDLTDCWIDFVKRKIHQYGVIGIDTELGLVERDCSSEGRVTRFSLLFGPSSLVVSFDHPSSSNTSSKQLISRSAQ